MMDQIKPSWPIGKLAQLVTACQLVTKDEQIVISGISADSRQIKPGDLFVSLKGAKAVGSSFIDQALKQGAVAVLTDPETAKNLTPDISYIIHSNPRYAYAQMAAKLYSGQPEIMVAVTGTNGKTSVVQFYAQMLHLLHYPAASIGTMGIYSGDGNSLLPATGLTTSDPQILHQQLGQLSNKGIHYAAMEASSHGLSQYRLHGVKIKAAAFTNLSHDHLDYHGTEADYFACKMQLFNQILPAGSVAVINADDPKFLEVQAHCQKANLKIFSYGKKGADLTLISLKQSIQNQSISFRYQQNMYRVEVPLVGSFQASNVLCALGLALASGVPINQLVSILPNLKGVSGRMEKVSGPNHKATVIVDYAHTPDGLEKALQELKSVTQGKLWVAFGCGGNRDKTKRPIMGEIAARIADKVIVTDDNPRDEEAKTIRSEILDNCINAIEIGDRYQAIKTAIEQAGPEDSILIAGKGHEKMQIIKGQHIPFDDVVIAHEILEGTKKDA